MEYRTQDSHHFKLQPRVIIHGGAGNIQRENYPPEKYQAYRDALITIITKTNAFMTTPARSGSEKSAALLPSALDVATFAVTQLEDNALFNSGHGAVFTRDGVNELEASVMVSRGRDKRGVGVMGLRRVRNPIALARAMLEHGQDDLRPRRTGGFGVLSERGLDVPSEPGLDVPSAQGHTQLFGAAAEQLAAAYGLDLVEPDYFFTQQRWDEHRRAMDRERNAGAGATWSAEEYLPQGTCGAVALDEHGVICVATSTGGLTNKLTGRIGDTPVVGAGFWAEEWTEDGDPTGPSGGIWSRLREGVAGRGPSVVLGDALAGALADCLPVPRTYAPLLAGWPGRTTTRTTRSIGGSGTGNGDSFLRINALRTVGARARWKPEAGADAVARVAGPGGELQLSAGDRWGRTGEGEGGIIGIECAVVRDAAGRVVDVRSEILMDYNCGGMFRAWIDDRGEPVMSIWTNGASDDLFGEQASGGER